MLPILKDLIKLAHEFGPALVIVFASVLINVFFVWQGAKREERQTKQINDLHKQHAESVLPIMSDCREAIATSREAIKQNSQLLMQWVANGRQ